MPRRAARRWTTALAATALLAGAAISGGAAQAAPTVGEDAVAGTASGTVRYACTGPLGLVHLGITIELTNLPDGAPTGLVLPTGIEVEVHVDLAGLGDLGDLGGLLGGLSGFGGLGELDGLGLLLGDDALPLGDLSGAVDDVTAMLSQGASTGPFTLPLPGTYPVSLPEHVTFSPLGFLGLSLFSISCDQVGDDDGVVDEVIVDQQDADIATSTPAAGVVVARVTRELGQRGAGRVVAISGGRVLASAPLSSGVARLSLRQLSPGPHRVSVRYLGNRTTKAATRQVTVRGVRR